MKKLITSFLALLCFSNANASDIGQATAYCFNYHPELRITYSPDSSDVGMPGLFWLGILSPSETVGAVYNINHQWDSYNGGLYPPANRYDAGVPSTITLTIPFPADTGYTTEAYQGYSIYVGHGVLTSNAVEMVSLRRNYLNSVRDQRIAAGTWRTEYDSDTQFQWSLIQKNMVDNNKYNSIYRIPFIDCTPPNYYGGNH
jgi:hypothetical protein